METFTVKEIAEILKIQEQTVRVWLRSGDLKGFTLNKSWRVTREDLDAFIEKRSNQ